MARTGRPKVAEPKSYRCQMRFTEKQRERLFEYAEKRGLSVAEVINEAVMNLVDSESLKDDRSS